MQILTPERAFEPLPNEVSIPLDKSVHDFKFTRNWFRNRNQATFSTFLKPRFENTPIRMIQIGVFEGYDLSWSMQNVANHPDSRVVAIDPWEETTKLDQEYMNGVEQRARHNLSPWKDKIEIIKGKSQDVLSSLNGSFSLIIIDGDHTADAVFQDAILSFALANSGGLLLFDDVRNRVPKKDHVQDGLDRFLETFGNVVKLSFRHRYCDAYEKI